MSAHRAYDLRAVTGRTLRQLLAAGAIVALSSCSPSMPGPQAGGGIGGSGSVTSVSSGPVTKLNSLFVSGTEYDDSTAVYCMDDQPCSATNTLKVGMVVSVAGAASPSSTPQGAVTRTAHTVTFTETVEGVVQAVAPDHSGLIVLGQFIDVNPKTVVDDSIPGRSIGNLVPKVDAVKISGFVVDVGHIVATLIMKQSGTPHVEATGIVKHHDAALKRFAIGQLTVEYASADIGELAAVAPGSWNGSVVHVRGAQASAIAGTLYDAQLIASRVKPLGFPVLDSADAKLEGFITHVDQPGNFHVDNHAITLLPGTTFDGGTAMDLALGAHVFIHGALVQGVLEAKEIVFKENLHIEANVVSTDVASGVLSVIGLPPLQIERDEHTVVKQNGSPGRFEDIGTGDHVRVHGRLLEGQRIVAMDLDVTAASPSVVLDAPLQLVQGGTLLLAGIQVDTGGIPDEGFLNRYGVIGRTAFFGGAVPGRPVWVKGTADGRGITWTSAGLAR